MKKPLIFTAAAIIGLAGGLYLALGQGESPAVEGRDFSALVEMREGDMLKLQFGADRGSDVAFLSEDGEEITLAAYEGQHVVLNFWATWCAPCIAEMPSLDRLEAQMGGDDFAVVPISLDRRASDIPAFFDRANIENLPAWHDASFGLNGQLALPGLPTSIFYDRAGREIARIPGEAEWDSEDALALIAHLIERP